jgi:hypothetical protein
MASDLTHVQTRPSAPQMMQRAVALVRRPACLTIWTRDRCTSEWRSAVVEGVELNASDAHEWGDRPLLYRTTAKMNFMERTVRRRMH